MAFAKPEKSRRLLPQFPKEGTHDNGQDEIPGEICSSPLFKGFNHFSPPVGFSGHAIQMLGARLNEHGPLFFEITFQCTVQGGPPPVVPEVYIGPELQQ